MERELLSWISKKRNGGICIDTPMIRCDKKRTVINFNSKFKTINFSNFFLMFWIFFILFLFIEINKNEFK